MTAPATSTEVIEADLIAGSSVYAIVAQRRVGDRRVKAIRDQLLADGKLTIVNPLIARDAEIARRLRNGETTATVCEAVGVKPNVVWKVAKVAGVSIARVKAVEPPATPKPAPFVPGRLLPAREPVHIDETYIPADARPLEQLAENDCRWPFGPRHHIRYCGHAVERQNDYSCTGRYCTKHRRWASASTVDGMRAAAARKAAA